MFDIQITIASWASNDSPGPNDKGILNRLVRRLIALRLRVQIRVPAPGPTSLSVISLFLYIPQIPYGWFLHAG